VGKEKVIAVVTDNAANMKRAWTIVLAKYNVLCYSCAAHCLNLLAHDICGTNTFKAVLDEAIEIIKFFRSNSRVYAVFQQTY